MIGTSRTAAHSLLTAIPCGLKEGATDLHDDLTSGELRILFNGLSDEVAFTWVLIHLGLGGTGVDWIPDSAAVQEGLDVLERLVQLGLVEVGRTEYLDGGPPGRVAPYRHVPETMSEARRRVETACRDATSWPDWAFSCWVVNTDRGNSAAWHALQAGEHRSD